MPIVTFPYEALHAALGRGAKRAVPDRPSVLESLAEMGCAIDGPPDGAVVSVEALMNRPDLFSVEGIARSLRPFRGVGPSPTYPVLEGPVSVTVEAAVLPVRGEIACAVVRGVDLDDASLRLLLDGQEKLDLTYGRKRTRVSIGLHDLGPLTPPITYTAVPPPSVSFVPLFAEPVQGAPRAMTLKQIIEEHPKGRAYGQILAGAAAYPLLHDAKRAVLSFPPIINGLTTELKPGRRDLFLDVTGTAQAPVHAAADLLAMLLAERGGRIESVEVNRPGAGPVREPVLQPSQHSVSLASASLLVGVPLRADEAAGALERMGHRALVVPGGKALDVFSPPWRFDLLHEVDLIEDLAIGLGYRSIPPVLPRVPTIGQERPSASAARRAAATLMGLGFQEVMTLTLTSPDENERSPIDDTAAYAARGFGAPIVSSVTNPITRDHSTLRNSLIPGLLALLAANTGRDLPQAVFEVGDVVLAGHNVSSLAGAYLGSDASFTRAKSVVQALCYAFSLPHDFQAAPGSPLFVAGRLALLRIDYRPAGCLGEVAPAALGRYGLVHPAFAFELRMEPLEVPLRGSQKRPGEISQV